MRANTRNYLLTALGTLAILVFSPALQATQSITLTNTPYTYEGQSVGPYTANITPTPGNLLVFCLDGNQHFNPSTGILSSFSSLAGGQTSTLNTDEEEAAFLASYSLTLDPNHNNISVDEGPMQLAIWSIMGTLPSGVTVSLTVNSAAYAYKQQAATFVSGSSSAALSAFMSTVKIWTPDGWSPTGSPTQNQRFITFTPEPGTMVFMGTGVLLLALSRIRRRR